MKRHTADKRSAAAIRKIFEQLKAEKAAKVVREQYNAPEYAKSEVR